ncbi:TOMM precursor leader peptide-binding protein [Actinomadura harenae]|nr:TOMM precursor leader peptide-binding protein [Actinomadura harenae]
MSEALVADTRVPAEGDGAWLPVEVTSGWVSIGPAVLPGRPGCPTCLRRRRDANRGDSEARAVLDELYGPRPSDGRLLLPVVSSLVEALVKEEVAAAFPRTRDGVLRVSTTSAVVTAHRLTADPVCPDCSEPVDEHPRHYDLGSAPKPDPTALRVRPLTDDLEERFVDPESGLIGSLGTSAQAVLPTVVARLDPGRKGDDGRHGYGRAMDFASARRLAIGEALERYATVRPRGRRPVRARYADVADHALDPRTLGLYPDEWYDEPDFGFTRFDPHEEARWVWGYSLRAGRPVLVPQDFAYYGGRRERRWAYECSNGAALGGCLAEAVLYGLLEVAERDAFLITWYGRLPVPRVDLDAVTDRRIPLLAALTRQDAGYELRAFAMPMEQRVPAVWAMAVDVLGGPGRPRTLCAASAHPDPEHALGNALFELMPSLSALGDVYDERAAAAMLADADLVRDMEDHRRLYCHPDASSRFAFLPADEPARPLTDLVDRRPPHDDLADDLAELAGCFLATGLDVIAVDVTCPQLEASGLAAAKVLVPGAVPMTFGHRHRRVHDLPRLLTVPRLLGHRDRDLRPDELNPHPHPFP